MRLALVLFLVFTCTVPGMELNCNATYETICYGALEQPLCLHLSGVGGYEYVLKKEDDKNGTSIFRLKRGKINFYSQHSSTRQRWYFYANNATLIINPAKREDSGVYRMHGTKEITGERLEAYTLQIIIMGASDKSEDQYSSQETTNSASGIGFQPPTQIPVEGEGGISPVFMSVWLVEIIILIALLGWSYYDTRNRKPPQSGHSMLCSASKDQLENS
ncbi:uncharacterized protein LOC134069269 isoform X1 [Sardina pilchardus]|uniref:uncharacterized protein LOC134069269 isoform X1 n=1 Tax=Sardina pilchardus TaxID=27697 RepID=UPI002E12F51D